tara:strand:+ start:878 stop:1294 length:417 start_codon:yes stop_codon:yes gene_type:complete
MVAFLAPLGSALAGTAGRIVTKRVITYAGGAIVTWYAGTTLLASVDVVDEDDIQAVEDAIKDAGGTIITELGNATLEVIEGAGEALVKGLDKTFNYIGDRFISGKEPEIVAGFTVTILSLLAAVYLYNSVKNANDVFN